jgi:proline racemase
MAARRQIFIAASSARPAASSSARMAQSVAKCMLAVGEEFVHESIIGILFHYRIQRNAAVAITRLSARASVGGARVIGHNAFLVDENDPLAFGLQLA